MWEIVQEYWYYIPVVGGSLVVLGWEHIVKAWNATKSNNFGFKKDNSEKEMVSCEVEDQNAIAHLRKRAAELGDDKLITLIKKLDSEFYDIHVCANLDQVTKKG